ncbi:hypothetical protein CEXT_17131 [Caerostris extrusa]|uniref:Uncharacterized protein n=1 Tax=Caerostris extrusa TaxID=172846 RepID=A0AAV4S178_CAEEX|nr:hypothetical protein CEXT_17131 [Caerostris extrusa]
MDDYFRVHTPTRRAAAADAGFISRRERGEAQLVRVLEQSNIVPDPLSLGCLFHGKRKMRKRLERETICFANVFSTLARKAEGLYRLLSENIFEPNGSQLVADRTGNPPFAVPSTMKERGLNEPLIKTTAATTKKTEFCLGCWRLLWLNQQKKKKKETNIRRE